MSVIVKDMQMPKACMLCPIYDGEYGECGVLHDRYLFPFLSEDTYRYDATKEIHKDCPLVERPQGEWIDHSSENLLWGHNECPFCHKRSNKDASYCQYCGADMRKGDAE